VIKRAQWLLLELFDFPPEMPAMIEREEDSRDNACHDPLLIFSNG